MTGTRSFPTGGVLNRPRFSPIDVIVFLVIALVLLSASCGWPTP